MKKIACLIIAVCISGGSAVVAQQSEVDAYKLSQTDINGTARYLSMGGAFGALGGDISSMYTNPAGLGIFRTSEIVGTVSLNMFKTNSNWNGSKSDMNKTTFNLDNFAYAGYFPTGNDEGIIGWNFGFSYNKLKNFNRQYTLAGKQKYSMSDYTSAISSGIPESSLIGSGSNNPYYGNTEWLPILGFQGGFFFPDVDFPDYYLPTFGGGADYTTLFVKEWGGIDQYNFSFATNISDFVFVGATFGVTDINYRVSTTYDEEYGAKDYLYLDNHLSTDGTGYNFNLGVIVRPTDYLRLGVAYNSPTWYKMTDYFHAEAGTYVDIPENSADENELNASTPSQSAYDYQLRTPDKWIFSLAGILGQNALISFDYELSNYSSTRLKDVDGRELKEANNHIRNNSQSVHTFRLGGEYKITPRFAVRAGGYWQSSYAKSVLENNEQEVFTAGTLPHYTVNTGTFSASVGLGYRFTPNFYMDMAYVFRQQKENAYAFSSVYFDQPEDNVYSTPAELKTNTSRVALTLGYKF
ncbi:MAG: outer membrane protein transport protein [Tannerellaceae bacterium]|nr:outer membrane protein transport protein [Tannerellaceae bacterium]